jgi:hypothetical protein
MATKSEQNARYPDASVPSITIGAVFEQLIARRHGLVLLLNREDQLTHGDAMGQAQDGPIYHEIKHDPHTKYRHLMIEVAERRQASGAWVASGIFAGSDAHYYWQGDEMAYWRFAKSDLIDWAAKNGVTAGIVNEHLAGKVSPRIKDFNGTMLRIVMPYQDADRIGHRINAMGRAA